MGVSKSLCLEMHMHTTFELDHMIVRNSTRRSSMFSRVQSDASMYNSLFELLYSTVVALRFKVSSVRIGE